MKLRTLLPLLLCFGILGSAGSARAAVDLTQAKAHWLTRDTIASNLSVPAGGTVRLCAAAAGGLQSSGTGLTGGTCTALTQDANGLSAALKSTYPVVASYAAFKLGSADVAQAPTFLRGQLAIEVLDAGGNLLDATGLQIYGVLDDLFAYTGALGLTWSNGVPSVHLWAPTAVSVSLELYATSDTSTHTVNALHYDVATGVWSGTGATTWKGQFYDYDVAVYVPSVGQVVHNHVTDPYSLALATNSTLTAFVDPSDPSLAPPGWASLPKPALEDVAASTVYELHVREFSINDATVPKAHRGTYLAFTDASSDGMQHLSELADAGLTHVQLMPLNDYATVDEAKRALEPTQDYAPIPAQAAAAAPDSTEQEQAVAAVANTDTYDWGYDPWHYFAPEGSYASDPNGGTRVLELRQAVQGLAQSGLRVVVDVVFNHTVQSGQDPTSVLDRIVPGYYQRLDPASGAVLTSTCCANTAPEHRMMRRLIKDAVLQWATLFKVDGFRFDLMGFLPKDLMVEIQTALSALTLAKDGVEGTKILLYGEGWNFGEVQNNALFVQASQLNLGGTGIGTFSDRLRDSVRGGNPFSAPSEQGFATGLFLAPNARETRDSATQQALLLLEEDRIRVGLTGNLAGYVLETADGNLHPGAQVDFNGSPTGYTQSPLEAITYVTSHDNQTLFDAVQLKAPGSATLADRVRMQVLALATVALGQGRPFFYSGDELLRSKDGDSNSFNSGDWFNRLDWTYQSDNWGVGLPVDNTSWSVLQPLLANAALKPGAAEIALARAQFDELLAIRKSSRLFRLSTAAEVGKRVTFENVGPNQTPGLIVMDIEGDAGSTSDFQRVVVIFNAAPSATPWTSDAFKNATLQLHPVQATSADAQVRNASFDSKSGTFTLPARTAAVFVEPAATPPPKTVATPPPNAPVTKHGCGCGATEGGDTSALLFVLHAWWRRRSRR